MHKKILSIILKGRNFTHKGFWSGNYTDMQDLMRVMKGTGGLVQRGFAGSIKTGELLVYHTHKIYVDK